MEELNYSEILAKHWPNGSSSVESVAHPGDQQGLRWPGLYPPAFLSDQIWAAVEGHHLKRDSPAAGQTLKELKAGGCLLSTVNSEDHLVFP